MNEIYKAQMANALARYVDVSEAELLKFLALVKPVSVNRTQYFIRAGEKRPWLGFVVCGVFRCFHIDETGAEYTKHFFFGK